MKVFLTVLSIFTTVCFVMSCKKESHSQPMHPPTKTIRFVLYTNEDFSNDNDTISFTVTIRTNSGTINSRTIFDSTLATRRIKDIPGPLNKLVFEKTVPDNGSVLAAGFIYTTRFGIGSHFDTVGTNVKFKDFEYAFQ